MGRHALAFAGKLEVTYPSASSCLSMKQPTNISSAMGEARAKPNACKSQDMLRARKRYEDAKVSSQKVTHHAKFTFQMGDWLRLYCEETYEYKIRRQNLATYDPKKARNSCITANSGRQQYISKEQGRVQHDIVYKYTRCKNMYHPRGFRYMY